MNTTYHTSRGGNSNGLHVTQGSAPESDRHVAIPELSRMERRNGCVAQMDMPRTDAATGDGLSTSPDFAPTRRGMPETSYKAAASVVNLGRTRDAILHLLRMHGPMTDEHIWARYLNTKHYREDYPNVSPSGLRSRRSELVKLGLVCDSGQRAKTQSGRESIVWRIK